MANPHAHHLIDPAYHILVVIDHQARHALYHTENEDGSVEDTTHLLHWSGTEVRSQQLTKEEAAIPLPQEGLLTVDDLIGKDATLFGEQAAELLRMVGAVDVAGRVRPRAAWATLQE